MTFRSKAGLSVITLLLVGLIGYVGMAGYLYFFQSSMVFHPKKGLDATPEQWGMVYENAEFVSEGYRLNGWWIPGDTNRPVLLFLHGNASVLSGLRPHIELFRRLGLGLFLFDYRGYGLSEGHPTEEGVYADSLAAWEYVTKKQKIHEKRLIYYGQSLGGGAATWLATRHPPQALIVEGTFTSIPDVGAGRYPYLPIRLMSRIFFDNLTRIKTIHVPVLIIHSLDDVVIPVQQGRILHAAANEPKFFLETHGPHKTSFSDGGSASVDGLRRFLGF
ncbi:MAG: alpha/beta hydrolase [Magnetococcus sp. YQC-5]